MTILDIAQAAAALPALVERGGAEPVVIADAHGNTVARLFFEPRESTATSRLAAAHQMLQLADEASAFLEADLAADNISIEDFLDDVRADV